MRLGADFLTYLVQFARLLCSVQYLYPQRFVNPCDLLSTAWDSGCRCWELIPRVGNQLFLPGFVLSGHPPCARQKFFTDLWMN